MSSGGCCSVSGARSGYAVRFIEIQRTGEDITEVDGLIPAHKDIEMNVGLRQNRHMRVLDTIRDGDGE